MKKAIAIFLALAFVFCSCTVAFAEESVGITGGNMSEASESTVYLDAEVVYTPIISRFVYGNSEPFLGATVIRITNADGTTETLKIEKGENGYYAGDYKIFWHYAFIDFMPTVISPGINNGILNIHTEKDGIEYVGSADFYYFYLPDISNIFYLFSFYLRLIFNS